MARMGQPPRPLLATDRHVGEPVAMIIADTMQHARDAAELIEFDYDELPVQLVLAPGDTDIAGRWQTGLMKWGTPKKPKQNLIKRTCGEVRGGDNRVIVNSIEPRGFMNLTARLLLPANAQFWAHWNRLSQMLNMPKDNIRVTNPTGGWDDVMRAHRGFGVLAQQTLSSLRWMSDRTERC